MIHAQLSWAGLTRSSMSDQIKEASIVWSSSIVLDLCASSKDMMLTKIRDEMFFEKNEA